MHRCKVTLAGIFFGLVVFLNVSLARADSENYLKLIKKMAEEKKYALGASYLRALVALDEELNMNEKIRFLLIESVFHGYEGDYIAAKRTLDIARGIAPDDIRLQSAIELVEHDLFIMGAE